MISFSYFADTSVISVGLYDASVNGVNYENMADAVAAANSATEQVTIKLLKNVSR